METGILCNCTRCGQGIKNVFEYQGKPYGCECVQIVSGVKTWEMGDRRNVDEYIAFKAERAAQIEAKEAQIQQSRDSFYSVNGWLIDYLMDKDCQRLYTSSGTQVRIQEKGFCYSIAEQLFTKTPEDLSDKQFQIVADMWCKDFGGRSGSKKYDKAWDDFCDKCGIE